MKTAVNRGGGRGGVISQRTVGNEEGRRNEEVALLVRIGSSELPLSIGKFQAPFDFLSPLRTVCFWCSAGGGRKKIEGRGGGIEEGKLQRRLGEPLKEFGSVTKFVSPSRELIERWLTEGLFYWKVWRHSFVAHGDLFLSGIETYR